MKWKWARAVALVVVPFIVLMALLEVRLATGMGPWDVRLSFVVATMIGAWMLAAWHLYRPEPEATKVPEKVEDVVRAMLERGATQVALTQGQIIGGGDDECGCGERHEPLIVVPLPDGECLVSHRDSESCRWAVRVPDRDSVGPAIAHHMEFDCAKRKADT